MNSVQGMCVQDFHIYIYIHLHTCTHVGQVLSQKHSNLTFQHVEETLVCSFPEVSVVDSAKHHTPKGVLYLLKTSCYVSLFSIA